MGAKTNFSKQDINEILRNYELGKVVEFKPFSEGAVQTNIFLKTSKGKFALRYYEHRSKEYVLFEVDVLHYFREHKYPCAMPLRNIHGSFVGNFKGKYYSIFEYVEGEHIKKPNNKQKIQMVRYLAILHKISEGYKPRYSDFRESHDQKYCIVTAKKEFKRFKFKKIAKERMDFLLKQLKSLKFPNSIPKGVVHCDYDISNIKFKGNKVAGILDFDDACYTHLIYDVASLVYYWCWIREGKLNFDKAKFLLNNYDKYRKLSEVEKEHIFDALKLISLTYMSWFFYEKYKGKDIFQKSRKRIEELEEIGRENFYKHLFN